MIIWPERALLRCALPLEEQGDDLIRWWEEWHAGLALLRRDDEIAVQIGQIVFVRRQEQSIPIEMSLNYLDAGITTFDPTDRSYRSVHFGGTWTWKKAKMHGTAPKTLMTIQPPDLPPLHCLEQWNLPDRKRVLFHRFLGI